MPQFGDDIFLGTALIPSVSDPANPSPMSQGVGPMGRVYVFDVVPLTLQAAGLAASQNPASGGSFTLTAGTGVTARTRADGTVEYVLDTPRCVTVTAAGANSATYRISGYDQYGTPMTQTIAAPSTSTVATLKAFKTVTSITNINATIGTNNLTAGFNDTLGLPLRVTDRGYVTGINYNNVLARDTATVTPAVTTDPATAATGDVRGTVALSGAADGVKRLVMVIALPALAVGPNATRIGAAGVTQV